MISETFNAAPEAINIALKWRKVFLEKRTEYNRKCLEKVKADAALREANTERSKEWFQKINKEQLLDKKLDMKVILNTEVGYWSIRQCIIISANNSYNCINMVNELHFIGCI